MSEIKLSKEEMKNKAGAAVDALKQEVSDEEIQQNLDKLPIKNEYVRKYLVAIPAVLSLILTLLPFIGFTASGVNEKYSVMSTLTGERISFASYFLILLPALVTASVFVQKLKPFRKAISVLAPILSLIFEIWTFFIIKSEYMKAAGAASSVMKSVGGGGMSYSCSPQIAFYLLILAYILTAAAGLVVYFGWLPKKKQ